MTPTGVPTKRVVSISLGTSRDNKLQDTTILGFPFHIERIGVDGDLGRFARMFAELDGKVDAFGIGGADLYVTLGDKRYEFSQIRRLISGAKTTPLLDGSGLKHTLERETVQRLQADGTIDFGRERVLLVSAVDRYGMAQALDKLCPDVVYGDLLFGMGLPFPLRSYSAVQRLGALVLPIITKLPFKWFYPTGKKQETRVPKHQKIFEWATLIAGDKHYIRRYAPDDLSDKTILTQSIRKSDLEWLSMTNARRVITTTPEMSGETFATNVMEAVIVAALGKGKTPLAESDYLAALDRLQWKPNVIELRQS